MPRPKPNWGFNVPTPIEFNSEPNPQEVEKLTENLSVEIGIDLNKINNQKIKPKENQLIHFNSFLSELISNYRLRTIYDNYYPSNGSVKQALLQIKKISKELETRLEPLSENAVDEETWNLLDKNLPEKYNSLGDFYLESLTLRKAAEKALEELSVKEGTTGRKSELDNKVWLAQQIAITFDKLLNISPTKTRRGLFDIVVGRILRACRFEERGYQVQGYAAEQNFDVIKTALDTLDQAQDDLWQINKKIGSIKFSNTEDYLKGSVGICGDKILVDGKEVQK